MHMKTFVRSKNIRCLWFVLNAIVACLPVWHTGAILMFNCCDGLIAVELNDSRKCLSCCNECGAETDNPSHVKLVCSCEGIPISKNLKEHTACHNTPSGDAEYSTFFNGVVSNIFVTQQKEFFDPLTFYQIKGVNTIDILSTTILRI
ncbi:MAG: hypothetical protein MUE70_14350 [Desulfobacterales bacterium]|nr:hypothetical protein [Desulfobacterales bacterium]